MNDCYACNLTNGTFDLPGGRIFQTNYWVVEHCTGPLGVGTLIIKPFRHCLQVADLNPEEAFELGPLLRQITNAMRALLAPDQIYVCLWSHKDWEAQHIHFVLQPIWRQMAKEFDSGGPNLQANMMREGKELDRAAVEEFCNQMREKLTINKRKGS